MNFLLGAEAGSEFIVVEYKQSEELNFYLALRLVIFIVLLIFLYIFLFLFVSLMNSVLDTLIRLSQDLCL